MAFTPEEADNQLKQAWAEGPEQWQRAVNTLLLDLYKTIANTRGHVGRHEKFLRGLASKMVAEQQAGGAGAPDAGAAAGAPAGDGPMIGADGAPLDEAAAEAERQMNAAAGPRPAIGGAPAAAPAMPARQAPQRGGVRIGADGTPADPALAAAEDAMDAAAGPRE